MARQGSKYIPGPTEIPFGSLGNSFNNRSRKNKRGANPRRFILQAVPEQIKLKGKDGGETLLPTGRIKQILHFRTN